MEPSLSNLPIDETEHRPPSWFSVWTKLVTRPTEQTVLEIIEHPGAKQNTAFIWVFVTGLLPTLVWGLLQAILIATGLDGEPASSSGRGIDAFLILLTTVCPSPIVGAFVVAIFGLTVGGLQWIARIMGGSGSYEKLVYVLGATIVPLLPVTLVVIILTMSVSFDYENNAVLMIFIWVIELVVGIYTLVLQALAFKVVNQFGWFETVGLTLLSGLAISTFCGCCLFFGIFGAA